MSHYELVVLFQKVLFSLQNNEIKPGDIDTVLDALHDVLEEATDLLFESLRDPDLEKRQHIEDLLQCIFNIEQQNFSDAFFETRRKLKTRNLPPDLLLRTLSLKRVYEKTRIIN